MEVQFGHEMEARLRRVAAENNGPQEDYVRQLVERYVDHDEWFRRQVRQGLAQLDRGEHLTHAEVGERIERMFLAK